MRPFLFVTALALLPASAPAARRACSASYAALEPAPVAKKLAKLGYDEDVAQRIARRDPVLAARLLKEKMGGKPTMALFHGMDTHPYDYDPKLEQMPSGAKEFWTGPLNTALSYSNKGSLAETAPPPGRLKNLTMVIEMKIPRSAVVNPEDANHWLAYSRKTLPDDTLFITRVGIRDWSKAKKVFVPDWGGGYYIWDTDITWYKYDEIFDENGKVRIRPEWGNP